MGCPRVAWRQQQQAANTHGVVASNGTRVPVAGVGAHRLAPDISLSQASDLHMPVGGSIISACMLLPAAHEMLLSTGGASPGLHPRRAGQQGLHDVRKACAH